MNAADWYKRRVIDTAANSMAASGTTSANTIYEEHDTWQYVSTYSEETTKRLRCDEVSRQTYFVKLKQKSTEN